MNDEHIRKSEPLRLDVAEPSPVVRIVLAEIDSPGPLHYLIEAEGFQVVGCASNDVDLARALASVEPDVIVLDADMSATSALVAREKAPSSELIVLWPEGVQLPSGAERVHPRLVYQDLGPAIRRAAEDRRTRHPAILELEDDDVDLWPEPPGGVDVPNSTAQRTSTRILVGTAALIALIVLTMGASFALEGRSPSPQPTAPGSTGASLSAVAGTRSSATSAPSPARDAHPSVHARCAPGVKAYRKTPNDHASDAAHGAPPACQAGTRGSTHRAAHRHGSQRASRPDTGSGNAKGGGNTNVKGSGTAKRGGGQGRAQSHPSSGAATPGGARTGPPG